MPQLPFGKHKQTAQRAVKSPRRSPIAVLRQVVEQWWERLYLLAFGKVALGDQARIYSSGKTGRDYVWNTVGQTLWGSLFPILTVIATRLAGAEEAGRFTLAFTIATLLLYLGNYGVRTYQVSDLDEMDSFAAYQIQRFITCALMLLAGWAYCTLRHYEGGMALISAGAFAYRAIDAMADVYEGRLQQMDKLYLSGVSLSLRTVVPLVVFTITLLASKSLPAASIALAVSEIVVVLLVTLPLALLETPVSRPWQALEIKELFRECFPAFAAMFLFSLIDTMPKFAMEGVLPYEDQVYYSAIYFPAQKSIMAVGFIYKPQLVRLANFWQDPTKRARFDLIVLAMLGACVVITAGMLLFAAIVGIPLASLLYATDFEQFRMAQYLMVIGGGLAAAIDFLFQILTVLREQASAMRLYVVAFAFVALAANTLIRMLGFMGAIYSYVAVMTLLFTLLALQYVLVRVRSR